ncbi:nickel ABC transporter permease subunit NikB [Vibrio mangrovi]|uniref:Nickel ABC transporter permease subunit NikB n=1 Tax=Vibrio mangrovi TaxID=474394 RepID=A0A1Y6ITX9_9VIBR|nr:nickel ABC transporter permease subunit NikB [Vibrio mangrovi]MDW6004846.1 nickel ABC transporter permease subunit NikB [Vibrio mangrovi]SMS01137.1 Nickel transport system permease protein NikB [Vibrio mangrovi]
MWHFIYRRLLLLIPILLIASAIIFFILRLGPSDPALDYLRLSGLPPTTELLQSTREMLGLNKPLLTQYLIWLQQAVQLDFGTSYATQRPVFPELISFVPATLLLAGTALVMILVFSVPMGVIAARYRNRIPDHLIRIVLFMGVSMPNFWLAFLLVILFAVHLHWLPALGYGGFSHLIMPAFSIALMSLSMNARLIRTNMLEVAGQRHVIWARLRGVSERKIEISHILRNAMLPVITALGMHIGELIGGTLVIESIFGWPGVGRYAVTAVFNRDYPVIQCFTLFMVIIYVVCNLIVDILYAALDPRIRKTTDEVPV